MYYYTELKQIIVEWQNLLVYGNLVYTLNWKTWWILGNRKVCPIIYYLQYKVWHLLVTTGSRISETNNIIKDFKAPLTLGKDSLYVNWKKVIKI